MVVSVIPVAESEVSREQRDWDWTRGLLLPSLHDAELRGKPGGGPF